MLCKIMNCYWADFILKMPSAMEQHATQSFSLKSWYVKITIYISFYVDSEVCKYMHANLNAFGCAFREIDR